MNKPCKFADIITIFAEGVGNKVDAVRLTPGAI
jgi:hypothetical protein